MAHTPYYSKGMRVPSVTTILGRFKDPGPLQYWAWNLAYEPLEEACYLLKNLVDLKTGKMDRETLRGAVSFLQKKPLEEGNFRGRMTRAANAGTIAHRFVEQSINERHFAIPTIREIVGSWDVDIETAEKGIRAFRNYQEWATNNKIRVAQTEIPLVSEKYGFGGTLDAVSQGKRRVVCDWKTSSGLYTDHIVQLAAYGILWEECKKTKVKGYLLCRFDRDNGDFTHKSWEELDDAREQFLLLLRAYQIDKSVKKRVK